MEQWNKKKCTKVLVGRDNDEPGSIPLQVLHDFGSSLIIEVKHKE